MAALPVAYKSQPIAGVGMPPTALVMAAIVSIQLGAALATHMFPAVGPGGAVSLRMLFAGMVLLLLWHRSLRIGRQAWPAVLGYGAVLALMNLTFYEAISRIPLGMAVTIEFLGPMTVALIGSRRWSDPVWALLAAAGVLLLTEADGPIDWLGVLFSFGAGACWAGYILVGKVLGERTSGGSGLALATAFAGLLTLPLGIAHMGAMLLDPRILPVGIGVAVLSSVLPYSLELEALRRMPPRVFGVLMSLEPAMAALAGLFLLGQGMHAAQWAGIAAVSVASVGATRN